VDGVAFKKTFSYAGFEQQPKSFDNPKVLLLNMELEIKSERENAEVSLYVVKHFRRTKTIRCKTFCLNSPCSSSHVDVNFCRFVLRILLSTSQ
jgi:hypothetical protein